MKLDNVTLDDAGNWTCELEEYKWGSRRGDTDKQTVSLVVNGEGSGESENVESSNEDRELTGRQKTEVGIREKIINGFKNAWEKLTECSVNCEGTD